MNAYSDYEKIVPNEKLPQFLFDSFNVYKEVAWVENTGEESFYQWLQFTIKKYDKYRLLTGFLDWFFLKLYVKKNPSTRASTELSRMSSGQDKKRILFRPFKYYNIIFGTKKYHHVGLIAHGNWDRLFAIKNFMGYIITDDLDQYVLAYLKEKNIKHLYRLIEEIENKLRVANPDYIVLWNDILPLERAIVLVGKKLGITTLEIQHGIPSESLPFGTGRVVDHVLVWGKYFKDFYVKNKIRNNEEFHILGYPYSIGKQGIKQNKKKYRVCCLGEDFERFNDDFLKIKLESINCLSKMCKKLGIEFIYRPHPGEDRELLKKNLADIQFTDIGEGIEETFKKADIFISFLSTSLIEAAMRQKISLQLMNYPIKSANFEKLGVCNKTLQTFDELENYLKEIISAPSLDKFKLNFNNDYVETRYDPIERFSEIIKDIENIKKLKIT